MTSVSQVWVVRVYKWGMRMQMRYDGCGISAVVVHLAQARARARAGLG
jgi:hypothetical protein